MTNKEIEQNKYLEPLCSSFFVVAVAVGNSLQMYHTDASHNPETCCFCRLKHSHQRTYYRHPLFNRFCFYVLLLLIWSLNWQAIFFCYTQTKQRFPLRLCCKQVLTQLDIITLNNSTFNNTMLCLYMSLFLFIVCKLTLFFLQKKKKFFFESSTTTFIKFWEFKMRSLTLHTMNSFLSFALTFASEWNH